VQLSVMTMVMIIIVIIIIIVMLMIIVSKMGSPMMDLMAAITWSLTFSGGPAMCSF